MEGLDCVVSIAWGSEDVLFFTDGSPNVTQWNTTENTIDKLVACPYVCMCCLIVVDYSHVTHHSVSHSITSYRISSNSTRENINLRPSITAIKFECPIVLEGSNYRIAGNFWGQKLSRFSRIFRVRES